MTAASDVPGAGANPPPAAGSAYATQPGGYVGAPVGAARNGLGTAALVLGILALVLCWTVFGGILLGVLAIIFGLIGRGRVRRREATNGGAALTGIITGVLALLAVAALIAVGVSIINSPAGKNLQTCLRNAGSDTTAQQNCQQQFRSQYGR